jgi:hypothetical protein
MKPLKPYCLALNETLLPNHMANLGFTGHAIGKWQYVCLALASRLSRLS